MVNNNKSNKRKRFDVETHTLLFRGSEWRRSGAGAGQWAEKMGCNIIVSVDTVMKSLI